MIKLRNRTIEPMVHILTWCMLFVFAILITRKGDTAIIPVHAWLPLIEAVIIFYLNYLYLIEKFVFTKRNYTVYLLINILLILFFRLDMYLFHLFSGHSKGADKAAAHEGLHEEEALSFLKSVLGLTMPTVFAFAIKVKDRWIRMELDKKEIENSNLQSELKSLQYQLQPHFFFNSLNNIYSLVDISPAKAQETIHALSKLMQYLLHDTNGEKVDLAVEINYLKKYIQLMGIRQDADTIVNYEFSEVKSNQYSIAPLLLIPIIENAYKHGVSAIGKSLIVFEISVTNNTLVFISTNSNHPKNNSDMSGSGIGLDNLQKRLNLIYPEKHSLVKEIKKGMFCLTLTIELEKFNTT